MCGKATCLNRTGGEARLEGSAELPNGDRGCRVNAKKRQGVGSGGPKDPRRV